MGQLKQTKIGYYAEKLGWILIGIGILFFFTGWFGQTWVLMITNGIVCLIAGYNPRLIRGFLYIVAALFFLDIYFNSNGFSNNYFLVFILIAAGYFLPPLFVKYDPNSQPRYSSREEHDGLSKKAPCYYCHGNGYIREYGNEAKCRKCNGSGKIETSLILGMLD